MSLYGIAASPIREAKGFLEREGITKWIDSENEQDKDNCYAVQHPAWKVTCLHCLCNGVRITVM